MRVGSVDVVAFGKRAVKRIGSDDVSGLAAELAYRFFLSLFPFFIFLAAVGSFIARLFGIENPTDKVMELIGQSVPSDASSVLRKQIDHVISNQNAGLLSVGIVGAVWAASSGFGTLMKGFNRSYEVQETRALWERYALRLGFTLLAGVTIILAFLLLFVGELYGFKIADKIGLGSELALFLFVIRWPVVIALILVAMAFLYWAAPNAELPFKLITPGALVFTALWLVGTYLFGLYVANFSSYNATYGALGGIVVLLIWFYWTAFLMLLGAEINANLARWVEPDAPESRTEDRPGERRSGSQNQQRGGSRAAGPASPARQHSLEMPPASGLAPLDPDASNADPRFNALAADESAD